MVALVTVVGVVALVKLLKLHNIIVYEIEGRKGVSCHPRLAGNKSIDLYVGINT